MNKPVACCISVGLLVFVLAGCQKEVKLPVAQVESSNELRMPVHKANWVKSLLASKTVPGTLIGDSLILGNRHVVGSVFGEIGRRSALRHSDWRTGVREASASELLPEISTQPAENDVSIDLQSSSVDKESLAIVQKYSNERTNASLLVKLLGAQLSIAQPWQQNALKAQLGSAAKRLNDMDIAMYAELKAHAVAVNEARKQLAAEQFPVRARPIVRRTVRRENERVYSYDYPGKSITWDGLTKESPADVTQSTAFQDRLRDTRSSISKAIQVLNASGVGEPHTQKIRK